MPSALERTTSPSILTRTVTRRPDGPSSKSQAREEKKEEVEEKEEKEEKEEDPSESLEVHLNGLPYEVTEDEIRQFFDGCGKIEEVRLSR